MGVLYPTYPSAVCLHKDICIPNPSAKYLYNTRYSNPSSANLWNKSLYTPVFYCSIGRENRWHKRVVHTPGRCHRSHHHALEAELSRGGYAARCEDQNGDKNRSVIRGEIELCTFLINCRQVLYWYFLEEPVIFPPPAGTNTGVFLSYAQW